ncbi:MAG: hypothetical protein ACRD82_23475, partial [Blastocatellia bacterium]
MAKSLACVVKYARQPQLNFVTLHVNDTRSRATLPVLFTWRPVMRYSITRRLLALVWIAALALIPPFATTAQNQQAFTVDDMLDVMNVSVADVSDDGRWVVATAARLRDRI